MSIEAVSEADGSGSIHLLAMKDRHRDQDGTVESGVVQENPLVQFYYKHSFFFLADRTCLTCHARQNAKGRQ